MRLLLVFDQWILDKCEKFSHKTQRTFGITCFGLARICLGIGWVVYVSVYFFVQKELLLPLDSVVVLSVMMTFNFFLTYGFEKIVLECSLRGLANPFKKGVTQRILAYCAGAILICIAFSSLTIFPAISTSGWTLLYLCHYYFVSCDPLPPAKSRVRALIEKIREALSPAPSPAPQES